MTADMPAFAHATPVTPAPAVEIVTIPCLADNYAFLIHDPATGRTALVDAPEAAPIADALAARGWTLTDILLTHHHDDHVQAVAALRGTARVIGAKADAHRLPDLDLAVAPGDTIEICGLATHVMDVPGHTRGHIAFHMPAARAVFTGDSLMALGCGRLFEGTPAEMWQSLCDLAALPPETMVYSGHEYTVGNAKFALAIDAENTALHDRVVEILTLREEGRPTIPATLASELATNPFLRPHDPQIRAHLDMADATDAAVFAEIRARKNTF